MRRRIMILRGCVKKKAINFAGGIKSGGGGGWLCKEARAVPGERKRSKGRIEVVMGGISSLRICRGTGRKKLLGPTKEPTRKNSYLVLTFLPSDKRK